MSGSSGGGSDSGWRPIGVVPTKKGDGDGPGGGEPPSQCNITENTTLNSPNRTVITTLRAGDFLDLVFESGPPQRLVARTSGGLIAGSITSPSMLQLIECIGLGTDYVVEVKSVRGAVCEVTVHPK